MLRSLFPASSYELLECRDGSEAFSSYPRFQPDWVVMDVVMEPMDGMSATRRITAEFPGARIIAVSEHDSAQIRRAVQEAGCWAFVPKEKLLDLRTVITADSKTSNLDLQNLDQSHAHKTK